MTYAVWGNPSYLWGDTTRLWGEGSNEVLNWSIMVDWDNTGSYTGTSEAQYCIDMEVERGRRNRLNVNSDGSADGIQMPMVGKLRLVFDNSTRRFDPYYTSGALYGKILPGRYIKVQCMYAGTIYPIFHGNIRTITTQDGDNPTVIIDCEDGMRLIQSRDINIPITADSTSIGVRTFRTSLSLVIAALDWPTRFGYTLPTAEFRSGYFWADRNALAVLRDLANAYSYNIWVDESGAIQAYHFGAGQLHPLTLRDNIMLKNMILPVPWENIKNHQKLYYYVASVTAGAGSALASIIDIPLLAAGDTGTYWSPLTYNGETVPAWNYVTPTTPTDYTANTAADGSGTNMSASISVSYTIYGDTVMFTVTNNHVTDSAYITLLQLRGDPVTFQKRFIEYENAASIAEFSRHTYKSDSPYCQNTVLVAENYTYTANFELNDPFIEVQLQARPDRQFELYLFWKVTTAIPKFGINEQRTIGYVSHKWNDPKGQDVLTTLILENIR